MKKKYITAKEFDENFDKGEDIRDYLDLSSAIRLGKKLKNINEDFYNRLVKSINRLSVGEKFKLWVDEKFEDTTEAGNALEIAPQTLYDYFNNKVEPSGTVLQKCVKFGLDLNWLYSDYHSVRESGVNYEILLEQKIRDMHYAIELAFNKIATLGESHHALSISQLCKEHYAVLYMVEVIGDTIRSLKDITSSNRFIMFHDLYVATDLTPVQFRNYLSKLNSDLIANLNQNLGPNS